MSTSYHAKYFASELTRIGGAGVERLSRSLFDACVDLNPHQIAAALFKKYLDRYYKFRKREFEGGHLEYRELSEDDSNFINEYRLLIERSREDIVQKLEEIKGLIETGRLRSVEFQSMHAIAFGRHLYEPLIYVGNDLIEVKPVVLENEGERDFVLDLQKFCELPQGREFLQG